MSNRKEETLYHAMFLAQHLNKCDLNDGLVYILFELSMESHHIGYHYARNAILLFYKNPVHMLLTGLYQKVIETVDPTATYERMEKSIRAAIKQSYRDCDPEVWGYYFPENEKFKSKKPSNYQFISQIAAFMELWQVCCKEASYEI